MMLERYDVYPDYRRRRYRFQSIGPKGTIEKAVDYTRMQNNIFNLAFEDWDKINGKLNDSVRTNNQDRGKVLATVAMTGLDFLYHHPSCVVFAQGGTPAKTRLYQMGINANWLEINFHLSILAYAGGKWENFQRNKNYTTFAASLKLKN